MVIVRPVFVFQPDVVSGGSGGIILGHGLVGFAGKDMVIGVEKANGIFGKFGWARGP